MTTEPTDIPADLQPTAEEPPPVRNAIHEEMAKLMRERQRAYGKVPAQLVGNEPESRDEQPFAAPVSLSAAAQKALGDVPGGGVEEPPGRSEPPETSSKIFVHAVAAAASAELLAEMQARPIPEPRRPSFNVLRGYSSPQWTPLPVAPSTIPTVDTPPAERAAVMAVAASLGRRQVQRAVVDVPPPEPRREIPEASRWAAHGTWRGLRARRRRRPLTWFRRWAS